MVSNQKKNVKYNLTFILWIKGSPKFYVHNIYKFYFNTLTGHVFFNFIYVENILFELNNMFTKIQFYESIN